MAAIHCETWFDIYGGSGAILIDWSINLGFEVENLFHDDLETGIGQRKNKKRKEKLIKTICQ